MVYWLWAALTLSNAALVYALIRIWYLRKKVTSSRKRNKLLRRASKRSNLADYAPHVLASSRLPTSPALKMLLAKRENRWPFHPEAKDVLPPADCDLEPLKKLISDKKALEGRQAPRRDYEYHTDNLWNGFIGRSQLSHLNALCISYLRRNTPHREKAYKLFHRIWSEQGAYLVPELNARWAISTLHTFYDYGMNSDQTVIGGGGMIYGDMIKLYETERAASGLTPRTEYVKERVKNSEVEVEGLFAFRIGNSDLMLNMNMLMADMALRDPVAGPVLFRLLELVQAGETAFSRMDRGRLKFGVELEGDSGARNWTFNIDPRTKRGRDGGVAQKQ